MTLSLWGILLIPGFLSFLALTLGGVAGIPPWVEVSLMGGINLGSVLIGLWVGRSVTQIVQIAQATQPGVTLPVLHPFGIWELDQIAGILHQIQTLLTQLSTGVTTQAQTIQEKDASLKLAVKAASMGVWSWNPLTGEEVWSPEMVALGGISADEPHTFESYLSHIHPDDRSKLLEAQAESLHSGVPYRCEYRVLLPGGTIRWLVSLGDYQRDPQGRVINLSGVTLDITESRLAATKLEQQQQFLRNLIDAVPNLIVVRDHRSRGLLYNQVALDFYGQSLDNLLGDAWMRPHPPELLQQFLAEDQAILQTGNDCQIAPAPEQSANGATRILRWLKRPLQFPDQMDPCILMVGTDLTEEVRLDREREQAQLRYQSIFENALDGIFQTTPSGSYLSANPALAHLYGYESPDELLATLTDVEHQLYVDPDRRRQFQEQLLQKQVLVNFESQVYRRDGSIIWISESARTVQEGSHLYFEGFVRDITRRKEAEDALGQSEALFRGIFEEAEIGIVLDALNGTTINVNPAMARLLGYTLEELQHISYRDYTHPDDLDADNQAFQQLMDGECHFYQMEKRCLRKDGRQIWVKLKVSLIRNAHGVPQFSLGTLEDITLEKEQQDAITRQREFLNRLIDTCPDLIVVRDPQHQILLVNKTYATFYGTTPASLQDPEEMQTLHPEVQRRIRAENPHVLATGEELRTTDKPQPNAQGDERWLRWVKRALPHPSGSGQCVLQVGTDVTELKQAELDQQIARQAAEEASRAKSTFLSTMSHELRTPLNGILGYAQILGRDPGLSHKQREGVRVIEQCGNHLLTLINDVLDISRVEANRLELVEQPFPLSRFLEDVLGICTLRAEQKGIQLSHHRDGLLPSLIYSDEKRLRQVLLNLLSNAIKFTRQGEVSFSITTVVEKPLSPDTNPLDPDPLPSDPQWQQRVNLSFTVQDTGVGIPAESLERIFSPFEQAGDYAQRSEGTGLGLAIAQRLVKLMGGELRVTSQMGVGSTFWFSISVPAVMQDHDEGVSTLLAGASAQIEGYAGERRRILIIDDRIENCQVLVGLLEPLGFQVQQATNGQEGLEKARSLRPDLIVSDLIMPVMDGFTFIACLRQDPFLSAIPCLASSASVMEFNRLKSQQLGYNDFLPKPIQANDLLHQIRQYLHLEWQYRPLSESPTPESTPELIVPPPDQLMTLFDAAQLGRIPVIMQEASRLQALDERYAAFAHRVIQLADQLDDLAIVKWLDPWMSGGSGPASRDPDLNSNLNQRDAL